MLYFHEPRLLLTAFGEFMTRLIAYCTFALLVVAAIFLYVADTKGLHGAAILITFFLIDRFNHRGDGERSIGELKGEKKNVALACTPAAYHALNHSYRKARALGKNFYLILLQDFLDRPDIKESLARLSTNVHDMHVRVESAIKESPLVQLKREEVLAQIESLAVVAYENAVHTGESYIHTRNFFVALSEVGDPAIARILDLFELSTTNLQEAVIFGRWKRTMFGLKGLPSVLGGFTARPRVIKKRFMNRAWTARPTPLLDKFSTDLTDLARAGEAGFLSGHEKDLSSLLQAISKPGKPNALLVGEPGSGKNTMIDHLAYRMTQDDVPPVLFDKRLVSLNVGGLLADATPEALAGRLQKITDEVVRAGNIVIFIPNAHDLFRTGAAKAMNAIDILFPLIRSAAIPTIVETYPREFKQYIEPRTDFLEEFQIVTVDEISEGDALRFLIYSSLLLEKEFGVFITFRALEKAVNLAHRYFREKLLPGSASDLLKEALVKAKQDRIRTLLADHVVAVAEAESKIPIAQAGVVEAEKLWNLENIIHKKLVNQETAVSAVSRALREYRSGLTRKGGPIASFLFVGPTGVGKTELAKILTDIQFGSKNFMLRFDMSEYQDKQSIFRFIGTPDGEKTGALTDAVLKSPYSLVLLDEFEKAHPDILNLFLQVFDDGRLTDSLGRVVDFQNTIIIATSNAHSDFIKSQIEAGKTNEEVGEELKKKLTDYFRPELINRFSDIIAFRTLKPEEIYTIANFLVKDVGGTLRETQGVDLKVDESALRKIAELGFSPVFGARPLRQVVSEKVRSALAEKILRREIVRGDILSVAYQNNQFTWSVSHKQ
jgi:ATP-dependent Clp protease ATP-binding subunit ClpC